ncbi:hypothetical protein RvY_12748 [Ramazzottius varieornatus]|uniref:ShKT domain-containing protein n=1 Tax=Ramazzottius varieornatus TaxID=947166 RepID=A0A1D1VKK5_RAMVA|nr:hypothetical protein RvY_12748 [Ramazzottius varieornatus]
MELIASILFWCTWSLGVDSAEVSSSTFDPATQKYLANQLNNFRRQEQATDMFEMVWDAEAQTLAQKLTDRCVFRPPVGTAEEKTFLQTKNFRCGLNLARGTGQLGWNETLQMWYASKKDFKFGVDTRKPVSPFTAMVWARSFAFGCGYTKCKPGTPAQFDFFACTFCPAGNIRPRQFEPYTPGRDVQDVCARCPGACTDRLCTNPCPFQNDFTNCDTELFLSGCDSVGPSSPLFDFKQKCKATCICKSQGLLY